MIDDHMKCHTRRRPFSYEFSRLSDEGPGKYLPRLPSYGPADSEQVACAFAFARAFCDFQDAMSGAHRLSGDREFAMSFAKYPTIELDICHQCYRLSPFPYLLP